MLQPATGPAGRVQEEVPDHRFGSDCVKAVANSGATRTNRTPTREGKRRRRSPGFTQRTSPTYSKSRPSTVMVPSTVVDGLTALINSAQNPPKFTLVVKAGRPSKTTRNLRRWRGSFRVFGVMIGRLSPGTGALSVRNVTSGLAKNVSPAPSRAIPSPLGPIRLEHGGELFRNLGLAEAASGT